VREFITKKIRFHSNVAAQDLPLLVERPEPSSIRLRLLKEANCILEAKTDREGFLDRQISEAAGNPGVRSER